MPEPDAHADTDPHPDTHSHSHTDAERYTPEPDAHAGASAPVVGTPAARARTGAGPFTPYPGRTMVRQLGELENAIMTRVWRWNRP
ncbi:hypothetical protein AB0O00_33855, partial [Kitasatospora sp. NPDC093558]